MELGSFLLRNSSKLDGGLPFRHDALSFLDALHAALAEPFVRGNSTHLLDVPLDISGNALTVSTHPALEMTLGKQMCKIPDESC